MRLGTPSDEVDGNAWADDALGSVLDFFVVVVRLDDFPLDCLRLSVDVRRDFDELLRRFSVLAGFAGTVTADGIFGVVGCAEDLRAAVSGCAVPLPPVVLEALPFLAAPPMVTATLLSLVSPWVSLSLAVL
jgi:hypothetical protein